jgi:serine/threonine protein kinase
LFVQILDGIEAAHLRGVCHRDLKPENVLFDKQTRTLVIADFGIAHFEEDDLHTIVETGADERLANFLYAAPEQKVRGATVDIRADIYALGLMLNEMFTSAVPQGTGFKRIADVSQNHAYLDNLVDSMLQHAAANRPVSVRELKKELIARGNQWVVEQRLNSLKTAVIPETEVDDPLIRNPISVDSFDYESGRLVLILNKAPSPEWITQFQNIGNFTSVLGKGPSTFIFSGNRGYVTVAESAVQQVANYARSYVDQANALYAARVRTEHDKAKALEREGLRRKIAAEEERTRILARLKGL